MQQPALAPAQHVLQPASPRTPQIPVDDIIEIWRDMSAHGRYEGRLWRAEMLQSVFSKLDNSGSGGDGGSGPGGEGGSGGPGGSGLGGGGTGAANGGGNGEGFDADAEVDATNDNGYFARYGAPAPQRRGEHFGVHLGTQHVAAGGGIRL